MLDSLTILDWLSLSLLLLLILLVFSLRRQEMDKPIASEPLLVGGAPFEPDAHLASYLTGDTNDALRLIADNENHFIGPDQGALALKLLSASEGYATMGGYLPADATVFASDGELSPALGSTDPAAAASSIWLNADADMVDVNFDDSGVRFYQRTMLVILALLALIPLFVRLVSPAT
ncbi:MAG: hypothetical protein GXP42_09840 [Chloroflexi bacterium]|nr:hypothetical protein [Chloroflexota bacterium]